MVTPDFENHPVNSSIAGFNLRIKDFDYLPHTVVQQGQPIPTMGQAEVVDSRVSGGLLRQVSGSTFSITYSAGKIPQTRIVEPVHPLLIQNNACALEC
jgi:hypothetical protein